MGTVAARCRKKRTKRVRIAVLVLVAGLVHAGAGGAQETFLGVAVEPASGTYLVLKPVNVRAGPTTSAKRLGRLKKGDKVQAVGQAGDAAWLAVAKDGKDLGFMYAPVLLPLIDGSLARDLTGKASVPGGPTCDYTVRFEGKSAVEGEFFEIADYEVTYRCDDKGAKIDVPALMFITEAPYQLSQNQVYQISIDILEIENGYDEIFSTILLYKRKEEKVVFDSVTLKEFRAAPPVAERPAKTVGDALAAAVEIAPGAWNSKVWEVLARASRPTR